MKILISFLLLFSFNKAICQVIIEKPVPLDKIEFNQIVIKNKLNRSYLFGIKNQLEKAFGKARVKKERDEVLGGYAYLFNYKGFQTYFNDNDWESSVVNSPNYTVLLNGIAYKIGDNIDKLKKQFPLSYQNKNQFSDHQIGVMISNKNVVIDAEITFKYDAKGVITSITIANDNS